MQEDKICPFPGLRPFNEAESIFFRGREEHIEKIISQLEEKKFVMLTGASGDGKSSLVYAGVIPNARAGFFKAKFNNWLIADLRPERSPLKNLAFSLAEKLNLETEVVEESLKFGFNSLVNLYKNSAFHLDYHDSNYKNSSEQEQKKLKRGAANLFILVDQFEEFFTNPENYKDGQASNESQLVVNLLLETARIALVENLPIYIVCTMRSDYIGQCAAFRGLPEFIGFSQFFVPRLKRKEIQQVISEPALLSGNSISSRLVETLINEIGDGFDQLPVLQHTLNRIWHKTEKGKFEMDLLHLAMVGGLPPDQLPESDKLIYQNWFEKVASSKKLFFNKASLNTVLNAHAYELFETAHEYYNATHADKIEKAEAQRIIKTAFQCLTKIDESRAVRNRMSLLEITEIINDPEISVEKVDGVLELFRLQGNTFLKPFAHGTENEVLQLEAETVLDITHESLIRNWDILQKWADEEHENWLTFQDFSKQLKRWLSNGKAAGFLLPIGALSFFENWYNQCQPNKYWLARYDEGTSSLKDKQLDAEKTLLDANEFIKASARRLFFSRTVLKYGATKIIAVFGFIMLLIACTYYYFDFKKKQNANVIQRIMAKGELLLNSPDVDATIKADFLINYYRLTSNSSIVAQESYEDLLNKLNNDSMAFEIGYSMLNQCKTITSNDSLPYDNKDVLSNQVFTYLFHRFENETNRQLMNLVEKKTVIVNLKRVNQFLGVCALMKNSSPKKDSTEVASICNKAIGLTKKLLKESIEEIEPFNSATKAPDLNYCISLLISIEDNPISNNLIHFFYPNLNSKDTNDVNFFALLVYSYQKKYSLSCIELEEEGRSEMTALLLAENFDNIPAIKNILNNLSGEPMPFLRKPNVKFEPYIYYTLLRHSKAPIQTFDFYLNSIVRQGLFSKTEILGRLVQDFFENLRATSQHQVANQYLVNYFIPDKRKEEVWDYLLSNLEGNKNLNDSSKLELAFYLKLRGIYCFDISHNPDSGKKYFDKAVDIFNSINPQYLKMQLILNPDFNNKAKLPHAALFLYPTSMTNFTYLEYTCNWTSGSWTNTQFSLARKESFWNYLNLNNKISIYDNESGANTLFYFLDKNSGVRNISKKMIEICRANINKIDLSSNPSFNYRGLVLFKIDTCLKLGDTTKAKEHYHAFIQGLTKDFEPRGIVLDWLKNDIKQFASYGFNKEALQLLKLVPENSEKIDLLINICYALQTEGAIEDTFVYLDQLFDIPKKDKLSNISLFRALGIIGGKEINGLAQLQLRKTTEIMKPQALQNLIQGVAERGSYYEALQYMPEYISESTELGLYNGLLKAEILKNENKTFKDCFKGNWNDAAFYKRQQ